MAYDLCARFPHTPKYYALLEPGAYQYEDSSKKKQNKFPFLSNTPRNTKIGAKIWTHNIYYADIPPKIPNCTTFMSKLPRFPYEAFINEDLDTLLCTKCGIENTCECSNKENEVINCQGKLRKSLFIGPPPRSTQGEGLSCPSLRDHGYEILPDGSRKRLRNKITDECPPFYNTRVNESTAFYQGCKWSRWTSKRSMKSLEARPGPADYNILHKVSSEEFCAERVRHHKRKTSKQLRYLELIRQRNILEGHPGPASYSPTIPRGPELKYLGPKAIRFPIRKLMCPGPTHYCIRRNFDPPERPQFPCHAKLPKAACFGIKAKRFKPQIEEGPSPASYCSNYKPCLFIHCSQAPFGCSTQRFKDRPLDDSDNETHDIKSQTDKGGKSDIKLCQHPTWEFQSKTIRMKPLEKKTYEPSPADLLQTRNKVIRPRKLQYLSPFFSSEGRFQPWNDWMPVYGRLKTPGPCYYDLEKPKCMPAVHNGPLQRAPRFLTNMFHTPAPNEYKVGGGMESILSTHNQRLKNKIEKQHTFHWEQPKEPKVLNFKEKEIRLINRSIMLLDCGYGEKPCEKPLKKINLEDSKKPKLLRSFLYNQQIPNSL